MPNHTLAKSKSIGRQSIVIATFIGVVIFSYSQPAQANPFKGLFSGILKQVEGTGLGIIKSSVSNPVGTFRLLNSRVFKIDGTEKYLKYYDKYGQYLKYVPGIGGQAIPPGVLLDTVASEAGLENGIPRDLNSILDEILGPEETADKSKPCFSEVKGCKDGEFTTLIDQIKKESVIASTGPLGIPDPAVLRAAVTKAAKRGVSPDKLLSNTIPAAGFSSNQDDRTIAKAKSSATLGEEGQKSALERIVAVDTGLKGVVETAEQGLQSKITQEVAKALLSVSAQNAGFLAMQTINSEQAKIDSALILNQLANSSEAQDSIRRARDTELNATSARIIHLSRRKIRF